MTAAPLETSTRSRLSAHATLHTVEVNETAAVQTHVHVVRVSNIEPGDQAAGTAGMKLVERPEPQAAINDVVVQVHASGFTWDERTWPSTWTDRLGRDRPPVISGQELAGVVTTLGYGTTGLSVGQRVFGLSDSNRGGTLAEHVAVEACKHRMVALRSWWSRARDGG